MKRLLIGAAVVAALASIGTAASARDYGYGGGYYGGGYERYRDSDRDGRPDYREWNRDRDRDGRPDQWDRYDNRRHHRHYRHGRSYYRPYGPGYGYYAPRDYYRPYGGSSYGFSYRYYDR